ncbi:hypothetical protein BDK51DRAFT_30078 [Blyttiomyces helicus]|uniref:Metaxin n=1 Tax=Blyttiomyces helicus TaxID=388810 RepID=A0A4P9W2N9_9FUNG|nr:hypothetical protein BDK51DRAFT_30078 [Blyttiomyces helicus]|eukprot:RKO86414.1 hypothetical protein BDK51DRAFT_30078 [Blyttiomyces helicus]
MTTPPPTPYQRFLKAFPLKTFPPTFVPPDHPPAPEKTPILYVFPRRKQHVTSLDVECVKYQALLAFSNYHHVTRECHQSDVSPSGHLPFLVDSEGKVLAGREIVEEVLAKMGSLESKLSDVDLADLKAFSAMTDSKLKFALLYALWYDDRNYFELIVPVYEPLYPWPLNLIIPRLQRSKNLAWMLSRKAVLRRDEILEDARTTLSALSSRLGGQSYFFGSKASSLDAIVFAYLHIILSVLASPAIDNELRDIVLKHDNLVAYARRIFNTYFASSPGF